MRGGGPQSGLQIWSLHAGGENRTVLEPIRAVPTLSGEVQMRVDTANRQPKVNQPIVARGCECSPNGVKVG